MELLWRTQARKLEDTSETSKPEMHEQHNPKMSRVLLPLYTRIINPDYWNSRINNIYIW
jgi:hypothetical protein